VGVFDKKQLDAMNSVDITKVDRDSLTDINSVKVDNSLPTAQKMQSFFEQVKNPYCFMCGDTPVRIRFVSDEKTLTESIGNYFTSLK
jgi:hypothetical protein